MKKTLTLLTALMASTLAHAQFTLPPLPYAASALEPAIDTRTMEIHHGRHHQAFINGLNSQLEKYPGLDTMPLPQLLGSISQYPTAIRNQAGGHYNHSLFWTNMAPVGQGGSPSRALIRQLNADLGGLDAFKTAFTQAAATRFGSGWAWLIVGSDGKLAITTTANQDNPLMDVVDTRGTPILGVDVWEHAYYLKYQNQRGSYLDAWWSVVNWNDVNQRFEAARAR